MKVLTLDFDGVIADSQMECLFLVSHTYLKFNENTKLFGGQALTFDNFDGLKEKYKETTEKWKSLRPYIVDAFCYYVVLYIIDKNITVSNQEEFNKIREKLIPGNYDKCVEHFHDGRYNMQRGHLREWLKLETPFRKIIDEIKKLENKYTITIATNNKEELVQVFLDEYGIKPKIITDSTLSSNKIEHLEYIKNKLKADFDQIYFVDDQVKHFPKLMALGVKCYLATWGYNNEQQIKEAKEHGVTLLDEDNFYKELTNIS
ncbi:MAG: hypothetical protein IH934_00635 [Nanoarchaeota archaeon]|nr:hypothetical protein [Nanoarchaeota archaeon]